MSTTTASDLLRHLAEVAARQPEPPGAGLYHYVHTAGAYLRTVRRVGGEITGSVERMQRRQWIAPDGSGRLLVTLDGEAIQPSGDYAPGRLAAVFITTADPTAVEAELRERNPSGDTAVAVKVFADIWKNQVVPPALQSVLLRHLAEYPDLESADSAVWHTGKERRTLVFDHATGAVVGEDVTALEGAKVPIPTPASISATEWLHSGYTATTEPPA
ncbi:hypothetical protein JOD54_002863 [Actinokineospora baliensis]|uniref:hypothetical protein n=1 Tax=Actinokineospora baliensis TaxID=547056 RepID=UPI00195BBBB8|nr:hypothetical protein [Actinokineospora baliensis]MBM7772659.1 hypothetical protein [Actinokineospora baliensis]